MARPERLRVGCRQLGTGRLAAVGVHVAAEVADRAQHRHRDLGAVAELPVRGPGVHDLVLHRAAEEDRDASCVDEALGREGRQRVLPDRTGLCGATSLHDGELTLRVRHRSRPGRRDVKAQPVVAGDVLPVEPEPDEGLAGSQLDVHRHRGGLGGVGPPGKVARDGELVAAVDTQGADHRALAAECRHRHLRRLADEHVVRRRGVVVGVAGVASVDEPPDPAEGDPVRGDGQGAVVVDPDLHESVVEHPLALAYAVPPALARRCGLARRCLWCGGLGRLSLSRERRSSPTGARG